MQEHLRTGTEVLDGLRGVAILLVLVFHTWLFSWFTPALDLFGVDVPVDVLPRVGYYGVDLFFVISGFVLFFPHAIRAVSGAGATHGVKSFALRRVVKIAPSYFVAFVFTAFSLASLHHPFAFVPAFVQHALFVNSFFDDKMGFANSVFWSLAIEAQFYVIFLPIAWAFRKSPVVIAALMVFVAIEYRVQASHRFLQYEPVYRQLPAFLDVFAAGMFAAYAVVWARTHLADTRAIRIAFTGLAIASALGVWMLFERANLVQYDPGGPERFDIYNRTAIAWGLAVAAAASCLALPFWRALIANRVFVFLSLISYNLYLWHTLVMIWLWRGDKLPHALAEPHSDDHWKTIFISLSWILAIAISTAITYFFERPIIACVLPQSFAFDWARFARRFTRNSRPTASGEKRS